jgi:hypothetical protein
LFLLLVLVILSQGVFIFAQDNNQQRGESEYYYFNFPIEKIYTHRLGYLVVYRRVSNGTASTYIPVDWFRDISGKGEIIYLGSGPEWPSMIVYYKNGEFSHVRLRLRRDRLHETWGMIPFAVSANMDERFQDIEEVKLQF